MCFLVEEKVLTLCVSGDGGVVLQCWELVWVSWELGEAGMGSLGKS